MDAAEFREQDREWRRRLQGVSLVSEAAIDVDEGICGLGLLSQKILDLPGSTRTGMMKRYAPTALAGLTAVASAKYDEGTFWPRVGEVVGAPLTQPLQQLFADTFRHGLDLLGLARFDTPLRNLGEILMHAGVPLTSLGSYIQTLQKRDALTPDLTGSDFCTWAASMSRAAAAAKGLDAPTWRFLSSGGDVASDFVDRFLAILDETASGTAPSDISMDALPSHIANEVRRLLASGAVSRSGSRARAREPRLVPRLVYVDGLIQVHLPPFEERWRKDVTWQLTVAGTSWTRAVAAPWPGDRASTTREPLRDPQRNVVVRLREEAVEWMIPVVDAASPLLVFDSLTRAALPVSAQLPKGRAWAAFPNEADREILDALEVDGKLAIIEQADAPYGWDDWSFALVDLTEVRRVRPKSDGSDGEYRWRYVNSITRPALAEAAAIPFIRTNDGRQVFSERPGVVLPPARQTQDAGLATTSWLITTSTSLGDVVHVQHATSSAESTTVDPWPLDRDRLVGDFRIQVQGPLGRGATIDIALAENTTITAEPEFRWFEPSGGLTRCELSIHSLGPGMSIELLPEVRERQITLVDSGGAPALTVTTHVDHMWLSTISPAGASRPAIGPAEVHRENLPVTELRLNSMPRAYGHVTAIAGGKEVQKTGLAANTTGIAKLNLAAFADTATTHGVLSLRYEASGRTTTLCSIRPKQVVSEVLSDETTIIVAANGESVPLELGVYLDFAPWREAESVQMPIGVDSAPLPATLRGHGPGWVSARIHDPWGGSSWPKYPSTKDENSFYLDWPVTAVDSLEDQFIAWVGGAAPIPAGGEALRFAIGVYGTLPAARTMVPRWQLRADVAELTRTQGWDFLEAARESDWSRSTHNRLLAEGWPATASPGARPVDLATWTLSPFLGLLESARVSGAGRPAFNDAVLALLGESAISILNEGADELAAVGAFRQTAEILSDWPQERLDAAWRAAAPVPGALLNADQRLIHARELFDSRLNPVTRDIARSSHGILRTCHGVLQTELGNRVRPVFGSRSGADGWPSLPCLSITLSLLARLAARGRVRAVETFGMYQSRFGDLAAAAPSFVEQDLILAELWLTHWEIS